MTKCDLCGAECKHDETKFLRESFKTKDVEELCPACADWVNNLKDAMQLDIPNKVKRAIEEAKNGKPVTKKRNRWFTWA